MARRKKKNPSTVQWILIGVGTVAVYVGGYYGVKAIRKRRARKKLKDLPRPEPLPPKGQPPLEGTGAPTQPGETEPECGYEYPGFMPTEDGGCEPGPKTPPGVYVAEGCTDFVFVEGDNGPQPNFLEDMISEEAVATSDDASISTDPTSLVSEFFAEFWGECQWPPPPNASSRIVNLYQALTYVVAQEIVKAGGRVLGTNDIDAVDEQVAERLEGMGYVQFDPDVVPEIKVGPQSASGGDGGVAIGQISVKP